MQPQTSDTAILALSGPSDAEDPARDGDLRPGDRPRVQATELPGGNGERILLVDDEDTVRRVTERLLQKLGYRVTSTESGDTALRILAEADEPFDLVLTDVVMPGITGIEMAERIRRSSPEQRILFTSGYTTREYGRAPGQPPQPFMPKPFSMADLARNVRRVLEED